MNKLLNDKKSICKTLDTISLSSNLLPVFLCIGSDRVTGDCFGPIVGHLLRNTYNINAHVYGTLAKPVTALNVENTAKYIKYKHSGKDIVAVDSSLGDKEQIGLFSVIADGIYPGLGVGKRLPKVGDYSITATVACASEKSLSGVRLGLVYSQAIFIADCINTFVSNKLSNLSNLKLAH